MHDLIGKGVAAVRRRKRWTQEETARWFRHYGLTSWRTSTVGSLEAGLRRPRFDEVLLMAAALEVTVAELVPDVDELVDLGDGGAAMSVAAIRALLSGAADGHAAFPRDPAHFRYPGDAAMAAALDQAGAERDRQRLLIQPLLDTFLPRTLSAEDEQKLYLPPTDAEKYAASRLGVEPVVIKAASLLLFGGPFDERRDAAIPDAAKLEPRSRQAERGLVTRAFLASIRNQIAIAYGDDEGEEPEGEDS